MKKTPIYSEHVLLHGKMVDYAGWQLPVYYQGIVAEHLAARRQAGLFDVSHMGEIELQGSGVELFLQTLVSRDLARLQPGRIAYSMMCNEKGGVVDDLLVYRLQPERFLLVVNAGNTDKVLNWITENRQKTVNGLLVQNVSDRYAQMAIQGPKAEVILQKATGLPLMNLRPYCFLLAPSISPGSGSPVLISRTGYTGEDGFEIYINPEQAPALWRKLIELGRPDGLLPAGLGARDSLRMEASLPLYGHEIDDDISPLEAGLTAFINFPKNNFIGHKALLKMQQSGPARSLIGFQMSDRALPRSGCPVIWHEQKIGQVTSGGYAPSLNKAIGMALINSEHITGIDRLEIDIRRSLHAAERCPLPFYRRQARQAAASDQLDFPV